MTEAATAPTQQAIPPIYRAILLEIERRRLAIGISMDRISELMGAAERSYAKALYPDTSSGRMARYETLQSIMDVVFCEGYQIRIVPSTKSEGVTTREGTKRLIKHEAATWSRPIRRELLAELGSKGGKARMSRMTPEQRSELGRRAVLKRWEMRTVPSTAGTTKAEGHSQASNEAA